jgi:alpha-glucosidase
MQTRMLTRLGALVAAVVIAVAMRPQGTEPLAVGSHDGHTAFVLTTEGGTVKWSVRHRDAWVILPSRLGFVFAGGDTLSDSLSIRSHTRREFDTTFTLPWGEVRSVRDRYNELRATIVETRGKARVFDLHVRVFNDGVAFRYDLQSGPNLSSFTIQDELTEFRFAEDMKAWWAPADVPMPDRQEVLYSSGPVSRVGLAHTPLTLQGTSGLHLVVHEADLIEYPGMYLRKNPRAHVNDRSLRVELARYADGSAVVGEAPMVTPWRTIQIADNPEDLAPSTLSLRLNPPPQQPMTFPITPMKYNGIWWGMHIGTMAWSTNDRDGKPHGATTEHAKKYIDFAAANGLGGTLVEGWNVGWNSDWQREGDKFSFTQPMPDFNLDTVVAYATAKGVQLILHNETATFVENYQRQLDSAFALYRRLGVRVVKTGYVNDLMQGTGHAHQSQLMVRHHRDVLEAAARYGLSIVMHEPIKDTGERRTFPNMLSREGARGQEYNAWAEDGGNPPEHETILFFTRMLAGPMDFTPGIFDLLITAGGTRPPRPIVEPRPRTTLAKQLALYVVLYSPVQMAADLPESYADNPAYQFIRDVAVDWDTTIVLAGGIGDSVVVARKTKGKDEWFIGAITDEHTRLLSIPTDFLQPNVVYTAESYEDASGAHWRTNPTALTIINRPNLRRGIKINGVRLAPGGGVAMRIRPVESTPGTP